HQWIRAQDDVRSEAAVLIPIGVVGDEPHIERAGRLDEQLPTNGIEAAIEVFVFRARSGAGFYVQIAVALACGHVEAPGNFVVHDRSGDGRRPAQISIVTRSELDLRAEVERGSLRHDVDDAGGGVLAEQRALRAFQYFDALELAEIAEAHAVAGAVYAIDHDADRGFEAGIVADGADAANARSRDGLARRGRHDETRREQGEILDILNA